MKNRFRLLGIKTGDSLSYQKYDGKDFNKVLSSNTYYPYYSCYYFDKDKGAFCYNPSTDIDIYNNSESKINIQISAIVGKNGTGKSTLLELLYLANYNLGCWTDMLQEWIKMEREKQNDENCKEIVFGEFEKCQALPMFFEIYFEKNNSVYKLVFDNLLIEFYIGELNAGQIIDFKPVIQNVIELSKNVNDLNELFYTIAINYSIYGLNAKTLGKWVNPLFHKNDGYKTPLVINPMRTNGNFDINDEMEFANYRLVSNLLIQKKNNLQNGINDEVFITDKQYVKSIRFKYDSTKVKDFGIVDKGIIISGDQKSLELLLDLYAAFYEEVEQLEIRLNQIPFKDAIQNYVIQKINKILRTYDEYKSEFLLEEDFLTTLIKKEDFVIALNKDNSHITFKLKQALNYLRNCIYVQDLIKANSEETLNFNLKWNEQKDGEWFEFSLEELLNSMHTTEVDEIIRNIPPSIFEIQIVLSQADTTPNSSQVLFSDLSSGEQQLIHSVNTVLYHLNNLNSVHYSGSDRLAYDDVNVIFDEIELYFHPEYQRRFISYLLKSIHRLPLSKDGKGIKNINLLFSTHSPFILSDIPKQNILMLDIDEKSGKSKVLKSKNQTFGGNIHEILASSFFLNNGYLGEKAVELVNHVIENLNKWSNEIEIKIPENEKEHAKEIIELIGNELVKNKLSEMYNRQFGKNNSDNQIS